MFKSLVLISLLTLTACTKELKGMLSAYETMTLNSKNGPASIVAGDYKAELEFKSKTKMVLKVADNSFVFKLPKDTVIPDRNGQIVLAADQVDQTYGIDAQVNTMMDVTSSQVEYENCFRHEPYTHCSADHMGRTYCQRGTRAIPGRRKVQFHENVSTTDYNVELVKEDQMIVGKFSAQNVERERVYEYTGVCY